MRTYCFTFNTEEETKNTFDQLFALFKDCRDFKEKKAEWKGFRKVGFLY